MEPMFYLVWVENSSYPHFKHSSFVSARIEAERLIRKELKRVFILAPIAIGDPPVLQPIEWQYADGEIPSYD